jgi:tripartite-type tricarboxylate transporter receptor subunit TctC
MSDKITTLASRRHILKAASVAIGAAVTSSLGIKQARAAAYPERPIKIVVPFAAAGPTDIMARILAQSLGSALGGNFIVENKPGAGGNIGIGYAAHAAADGYTLLVVSTAYVVNPGLYVKIPYDPYKDFAPITELGSTPNSILVTPKLKVSSIAELIARAKAKPGELNWASPGAGTTPHLSGEFLKIVGGIEMTHVPFNGAAPAIQALLAGTTQVAVSALPPVLPFAQSGEIKVLAVTSANRWPDLPDVPTMVELGYKDFIAETAQFFFAPGGTAPNIVEELSAKTMEVLKAPSIVEQLRVNGYEVTAAGSQALRKRLDVEIPKWRDIISKAGIKPV